MSQILLSSYPFSYPNAFSLDFDGSDDYISFGASLIDLNADFTFEAWINPDSVSNKVFFSGNSDNTHYWMFIIRTGGPAGLVLQWQNAGAVVASYIPTSGDGASISTGAWTHVALTRSGNSWQWYVNGIASGSVQTETATDFYTSTNQRIAMINDGTNAPIFWDGLIDEVRIWDIARTAPQIIANMSRNVIPGDEPNLTGYWRFEEGSGTTATDETGNNNGTLVDGPTYDSDTPY